MEASPHNGLSPLGTTGHPGRLLRAQPDAVLCRLARRGNTGAYDVLYRRYKQPVYAFVFHLLGSSGRTAEAEDIAQDAFTKAFAAISRQSPDGSFRHWIFTIARNRTFDHLRGSGRTVALVDVVGHDEPTAVPGTPQTAEVAENNAELEWLVGAVSELPERQREALVLKELGGFSHAEIASEMGTTVSATKKLINRGRLEVSQAASDAGYRPRRLSRDLARAAPVLPLAALGAGIVIPAGAAAGGTVASGTAVATIFAVVAVGGGAAVTDIDRPQRDDDAQKPAAKHDSSGPSSPKPPPLAAGPAFSQKPIVNKPAKERRAKRKSAKRDRREMSGPRKLWDDSRRRDGSRHDPGEQRADRPKRSDSNDRPGDRSKADARERTRQPDHSDARDARKGRRGNNQKGHGRGHREGRRDDQRRQR